jgi:hypothetical protein
MLLSRKKTDVSAKRSDRHAPESGLQLGEVAFQGQLEAKQKDGVGTKRPKNRDCLGVVHPSALRWPNSVTSLERGGGSLLARRGRGWFNLPSESSSMEVSQPRLCAYKLLEMIRRWREFLSGTS